MQKFIAAFILTLFSLTSCKDYIDTNNVNRGEHGLGYIKGTRTLVNGEVVRKADDGKITELHNYKDGKMIGDWFQYGDKGQVMSHGFGTEVKKYEKSLNGFDLTYCILSIAEIKNDFAYATLYMDNKELFNDKKKILQLSKYIFTDYADRYKIDVLLIFDNKHEYAISKSATINTTCVFDTIPETEIQKVNIH